MCVGKPRIVPIPGVRDPGVRCAAPAGRRASCGLGGGLFSPRVGCCLLGGGLGACRLVRVLLSLVPSPPQGPARPVGWCLGGGWPLPWIVRYFPVPSFPPTPTPLQYHLPSTPICHDSAKVSTSLSSSSPSDKIRPQRAYWRTSTTTSASSLGDDFNRIGDDTTTTTTTDATPTTNDDGNNNLRRL